MRILLVEPYYGGSHQAWADGYVAHSGHDVRLLTHEARFWKWRMQGAHVTLAHAAAETFATGWVPDIVLASSMLNLAGFLGLTRRALGEVPVALYCHESQFTYPLSPLDRPDQTYPMINWTSARTADRVFFNSEYHRATFFDEVSRFLAQFPDERHSGLISEVEGRSSVLPVGVDLHRLDPPPPSNRYRPPLLLWNQRWEHDKGPDEFATLLEDLVSAGLDFEVAVAGEAFVSSPPSFERLPELLGDRLIWMGFADEERYIGLVRDADVVLSTAHQEFFGVAVVEAMYAGAFPVLPDRLVYPERVPPSLWADCLYGDEGPFDLTAAAIERATAGVPAPSALRDAVACFDWSLVAPAYDDALSDLADAR